MKEKRNEFKIIVDGVLKTAEEIIRLTPRELGVTFVYFYIKEDKDTDDTEKEIMAARVVPDGDEYEKIIPMRTEDERLLAFEILNDYMEIHNLHF